jgi:hypothetical protein
MGANSVFVERLTKAGNGSGRYLTGMQSLESPGLGVNLTAASEQIASRHPLISHRLQGDVNPQAVLILPRLVNWTQGYFQPSKEVQAISKVHMN